jgi:hypothetical protein
LEYAEQRLKVRDIQERGTSFAYVLFMPGAEARELSSREASTRERN